jgi:predicted dehydrogenase
VARPEIDLDLEYLPRLPRERGRGIGCVGAGFIMSDCHLPAYRAASFRPVAIHSRTRTRAEETARRHAIPRVHDRLEALIDDPEVEVVDIAVPPNEQLGVVRAIAARKGGVKAVLSQKPLGMSLAEAREIVALCEDAGIVLGVNQNMRYDPSIRGLKCVLERGYLGEPVLATIEMRAIPHWMPWQRQYDWLTLRIMSIHHLDSFRFLFGDPDRIFASARPDPRTTFPHQDGICLYILEWENGMRASAWDDVWTGPAREGAEPDICIRWRVEGTEGIARGTIGWPEYPHRRPSTLDFTTTHRPGYWLQPRWPEVWFPDAFVGPMAMLLRALEEDAEPEISGRDNLKTMALVDAAYRSLSEGRAVRLDEVLV